MQPKKRQSVVILEVEDFIKRFNKGELVLSPEAKSMIMSTPDGKNFLGRPKKKSKSLPDLLGWAIGAYQLHKDNSPYQLERAYEVLDIIERCRAFGFIRDAKQQAVHYEQEIEQLKQQLASLRELNNKLTLENKRLHNLLGDLGRSEVGDVE